MFHFVFPTWVSGILYINYVIAFYAIVLSQNRVILTVFCYISTGF